MSDNKTNEKPKTKKKDNIHKNHRKRLIDVVLKSGIENVSEVQALEFILTLAIPRKDVNPLAHLLLAKFGSFANVLDAELYALQSVEGMGERSAKILKILPNVLKYYNKSSAFKQYLSDMGSMYDHAESFYLNDQTERLFLTCLDKKNKVILSEKIMDGGPESVKLDIQFITSVLINSKAKGFVLVHNHPNTTCYPSKNDIDVTKVVENVANLIGVFLVDHIIVGEDGCYSIKLERQGRKSIKLEDINF